eukprot:TRINITY_DN484_c0_g1_i2.p1 TRINITY_DN484_c0_g1~~TRINITY_DN484_c0_g1_i2.p1  ORF type:complete len:433 (+),score=86.71 TRINITY_DN484_c0_g1_i2:73-1371(+)
MGNVECGTEKGPRECVEKSRKGLEPLLLPTHIRGAAAPAAAGAAASSGAAPAGGGGPLGRGWLPGSTLQGGQPTARSRSVKRASLERSSVDDRMDRYVDAAAAAADGYAPKCAGCLRSFKPLVVCAVQFVMLVGPIYQKVYTKVYEVLSVLPRNILLMVFGAALCFFGGTYAASIAAIEAFRTMGGDQCLEDLKYLLSQTGRVAEASKEDDKVDANNDGIADVDQMQPGELAQHKMKMAMLAVDDPARLQGAVGNLWAAWLAVLATLRLEFARTTAIAIGIADMCKFPIMRLCAPLLAWALGPDLTNWVETIVDSALKIFCIVFAWFLQEIISAFYAGLRGGKMFAEGAFSILEERGLLQKLPDFLVPDKEPFNPDTTYLDEMIAYPLGAIGFYFQLVHGFALVFPLNIVFFPLDVVEWFLRFMISWSSSPL